MTALRHIALVCAAAASGACTSYSSSATAADLLRSDSTTSSGDCDMPRTSFRRSGASASGQRSPLLTPVALVYHREPPRRPHSIAGTVRTHVGRAPCSNLDLVEELRRQATAEGCDAVVVDVEKPAAGGGTIQEGSCLLFSR